MAISYQALIDYLFHKSHKAGVPMSGNFELTARCNLDCKMCYIHKRANDQFVKKQELSGKQWLEIASAAQKKGILLLLLTGGEPFLHPDFKEIYLGCKNMGLLISINTNGTMLTDEMIDFLAKNPPLRVNLTLYGASPETYEKLCGDPAAYDRAYGAVRKLKAAEIRVKLNYSATPYNLQDAQAIYEFAKEENLLIQAATYMFPPIRACENGECEIKRLTPQQSAEARWQFDVFRYGEEGARMRMEKIFAGEKPEEWNTECQELPTERIRCRAGATTFWMTYHGQMRPCGMMQVPSVNALELGFDAAWEQIRQEREHIMIPAKCTACKWKEVCEFCPANCYAENGNFETSPEYMCEKTLAWLKYGK